MCARVVPRVLALAWSVTIGIPSALAHGAGDPLASSAGLWPWSSDVLIGLTIAVVLFWRGSVRKAGRGSPVSRGRAVLFYSGLGAVFLALQTPLDVIAGHMFAVHQVQHLLLRGVAPMLLMLSLPSGPLIAGFPTAIRRRFVAPMMRNNVVQSAFGFLTRPLVCTTVYVTSLYFWQLPAYHDAALISTTLHYVMHISMLASGMLFFWSLFNAASPPWGPPFSHRIVMLGASMFANIPLGAIVTLKESIAYSAYDLLGRWSSLEPLTDELLGGLVMWIPGSMMGLIAMLLLIRHWGRAEEKLELRRQRGFHLPASDRAAPQATGGHSESSRRRRSALGLALIPLAVFAGLMALAIWLSR
jgi:putative membrane protein